jgi:hypothetical protein
MKPIYKFASYNTSWVLDAHPSQLHAGMSESAAIMAKAQAVTGKSEGSNKLQEFRLNCASKCTSYIKKKMDDEYDFIALI